MGRKVFICDGPPRPPFLIEISRRQRYTAAILNLSPDKMNTTPSPTTPEPPPPSAPPEELKPWYYQYWFLYPSFMFWPVWSILILRSPWHNGLISGAIAWAALFVGSYAVYTWGIGGRDGFEGLLAGQTTAGVLLTGQIILPGLLLTVITQSHWLRCRRRIMSAARGGGVAGNSRKTPRSSSRRRDKRRRKSR